VEVKAGARNVHIQATSTRVELSDRAVRISAARTSCRPRSPANSLRSAGFAALYANGAPVRIKLRTLMSLKSRYDSMT